MKVQFRLSYLIYLVTLFAISFAVLRPLMPPDGEWTVVASAAVPLFAVTLYFAFRFPILLSRLRKGHRAVAARRAELVELADEVRARARDKETEILD